MSLQPGAPLDHNRYHILGLVGRGGFGFVYCAENVLLHETVAVKELIPALVGDPDALKRFLAEAKATMHLAHERIVRTQNVFEEGGNYYIVMEYARGGSLEARLQQLGALPIGEAVRLADQIAEGLAYAHAHGIIHCDLKPANILLTSEGNAKIADFGLAHISDQTLSRTWLTPSGFTAGTLPYMSPEQLDGVRDDTRIDVYALGAILYRLLTGRLYLDFEPVDTPSAQSRNVQRIIGESPLPPSAHNPAVLPWLDSIVLAALAKRPQDRPSSAAEVRDALLQTPVPGVRPGQVSGDATPPGREPTGEDAVPPKHQVASSRSIGKTLLIIGLVFAGISFVSRLVLAIPRLAMRSPETTSQLARALVLEPTMAPATLAPPTVMPVPTTALPPAPTAIPPPAVEVPADWKAYDGPEGAFSFRYPPAWTVTEEDSGAVTFDLEDGGFVYFTPSSDAWAGTDSAAIDKWAEIIYAGTASDENAETVRLVSSGGMQAPAACVFAELSVTLKTSQASVNEVAYFCPGAGGVPVALLIGRANGNVTAVERALALVAAATFEWKQ